MSPFNPFNPQTVFSVLVCLVVSYAFGVLLIKNQLSGLANIGLRIGLGAIFATSVFAVIQSNGSTVMLPVLFLASITAATNLVKERSLSFEDIRELNMRHWGTLFAIFSVFYLIEGLRLNVEVAGQVFVGNPDTAFYSGYGHSLFNTGQETIPEHHPRDTTYHLYHFGDLWMSGIISNVCRVLPYYANGLVLRVLCMGALALGIFGWTAAKNKGVILSIAGTISALYVIVLQPFEFGEQAPMLFSWFRTEYPMYLKTSHLIVGICGLPLLLLQLKRGLSLVTCIGLLWLPFLNLGMILMPVFAMVFWGLSVLSFRTLRTKENLKMLPLLILASVVPVLYCWATGRLPTPESHVNGEFIYVFLHTFLRALLSQLLLFPYIIGAFLFWWLSDLGVRRITVFHSCLYLGSMVGFSYIYPQMQGNTYQLLTLHFQSIFAPLGIFGFVVLLDRKKALGILGITLMVGFSVLHCFNTRGFRVHYDWSYWGISQKNYHARSTMAVSDAIKMRTMFAGLERVKLGYFVCNPDAYERPHYSAFVHLKGLIPGLELYRLNPLVSDTMESKEMTQYFKRTAVGYEVFEEGRFNDVSSRLLKVIEPTALLHPVRDSIYFEGLKNKNDASLTDQAQNFCIPQEVSERYAQTVSTNQFVFHFDTKDKTKEMIEYD